MEENNYYNQPQEQENNRFGFFFKGLLLWDFFTDGDILGIFK